MQTRLQYVNYFVSSNHNTPAASSPSPNFNFFRNRQTKEISFKIHWNGCRSRLDVWLLYGIVYRVLTDSLNVRECFQIHSKNKSHNGLHQLKKCAENFSIEINPVLFHFIPEFRDAVTATAVHFIYGYVWFGDKFFLLRLEAKICFFRWTLLEAKTKWREKKIKRVKKWDWNVWTTQQNKMKTWKFIGEYFV